MTDKAIAGTGPERDEVFFNPPESAIKPEFIRMVKKAEVDITAGKGKIYDSIDDFIREIKS